jgi:predicted hotdog family 3-hydroxylacyl-ACP dehydratase
MDGVILDVQSVAIEAVVPHRGRMLLVNRLLAHDEDSVVVGAVVAADNVFAEDRGVPAWVGIEYMAQAISAWAGCRGLARGEPARIGFLLGTRRYACSASHFAIGAQLRIEARRELFGDNGMGMFSCRILESDKELARAQVSVFEPPDPTAFLEEKTG